MAISVTLSTGDYSVVLSLTDVEFTGYVIDGGYSSTTGKTIYDGGDSTTTGKTVIDCGDSTKYG